RERTGGASRLRTAAARTRGRGAARRAREWLALRFLLCRPRAARRGDRRARRLPPPPLRPRRGGGRAGGGGGGGVRDFEERSDEAIQGPPLLLLDCFASLAMTFHPRSRRKKASVAFCYISPVTTWILAIMPPSSCSRMWQ